MFAKDIEVGKNYIAKVYGRLTVIRVDQEVKSLVTPSSGQRQTTSWVATNLRSGKPLLLKSGKSIQRLASETDINLHTMKREELRDYLSTVRLRPAEVVGDDSVTDGPVLTDRAAMLHELKENVRWIFSTATAVLGAADPLAGGDKAVLWDLVQRSRIARSGILRLALVLGASTGLKTDHLVGEKEENSAINQ